MVATKQFSSKETVSRRYADVRFFFLGRYHVLIVDTPDRDSYLLLIFSECEYLLTLLLCLATWFTCPISGFFDPDFARGNRLKNEEAQPAEDPRAMIALARVNWLHSHYKIVSIRAFSPLATDDLIMQSNDDFLFTLCLFITEPAVRPVYVSLYILIKLALFPELGTVIRLERAFTPRKALFLRFLV